MLTVPYDHIPINLLHINFAFIQDQSTHSTFSFYIRNVVRAPSVQTRRWWRGIDEEKDKARAAEQLRAEKGLSYDPGHNQRELLPATS